MTERADLLILANIPKLLEAALAARYRLHRGHDRASSRIRAIVGDGMSVVDEPLMASLPALELIVLHGVGHQGIDLEAARRRGIAVAYTPDVVTNDVADLAIALWLAVQRRVVSNDGSERSGRWDVPVGRRASGVRVGILGMGRIGRAIARRAGPFAREIRYSSRTSKPDLPWIFSASLADLARHSDVLFLAAAGGPGTAGAVDGTILQELGTDGVLVNVARGSIVDEAALIDCLEMGRIAGAALDVIADEPHLPDALASMEQVVLSPHQGSATRETRAEMQKLVLANLDAHFRGAPLPTPLLARDR